MSRRLRTLFVLLPALAVCLPAPARGPSEEDEEALRLRRAEAARPDVLHLADSLDRDEDEIEKQAHAIADKHDLGSLMWAFRPRDKGGVGVGAKPDAIETKLLALAKKPPTAKELEEQRPDLVRMAKVTLAVGRVAPLYASQYAPPGAGRGKRDWRRCCDDLNAASQDLIDALGGGDPGAVRRAAGRVNETCNACHETYRNP